MTEEILKYLKCPITKTPLQLTIISTGKKMYDGVEKQIILEGILKNDDCIYPIINGIPRLIAEAIYDYEDFFIKNVPTFKSIKNNMETKYGGLLKFILKKNKKTKASFSQEWNLFNYDTDKVWDADETQMLERFLAETCETKESLNGKLIFDAGCGNGLLNQSIGKQGATIIGMDFSKSIERAFDKNNVANTIFIQGDVQFPPVSIDTFDIVHSSGVLICTNNSELTFSCLEPLIKKDGKMSVWLYQPVNNVIHNLFNFLRNYTSKLPSKIQYYLYCVTLFPITFIIKKLKGNKQNSREMMIDILDWFSPEFRWEHTHDEATAWFTKRNYTNIKIATNERFGFNIIGEKR
jgi:uncharacterized protein YbaR (Trm112 family)/SAM-dependent methyltransferase